MDRNRKGSGVFTIIFLLILLSGLLALLFHVYFRPETLGLKVQKYGMISNVGFDIGKENLERVNLYFSDEKCEFLKLEEREIKKCDSVEERAEAIINEIVSGPKQNGHYRTLPKGTSVRGIYTLGTTLVVDFSRELFQKMPGGISQELITIYSVVDSLHQLSGVKSILFLVDGKPIDTLSGHIDLRSPVEARMELIQ